MIFSLLLALTPGDYVIDWNTGRYHYNLCVDGTMCWQYSGPRTNLADSYTGHWEFDPVHRVLHLHENGSHIQIMLDIWGNGKMHGYPDTKIRIERGRR